MAYMEYMVEGMKHEAKLNQPEVTFGRTAPCTVCFPKDPETSRFHCSIRKYPDGKYVLEDAGSSNGTYVNETKLTDEYVLVNGDRVRIGHSILIYREQDVGFETQIFDAVEKKLKDGAGFHTIMQDIIKKKKSNPGKD